MDSRLYAPSRKLIDKESQIPPEELTALFDEDKTKVFRLLALRFHYRSPIQISPEILSTAEIAAKELAAFAPRFMRNNSEEEINPDSGAIERFRAFMDDDLNTPEALTFLFDLVRETNACWEDGDRGTAYVKASAILLMCEELGLEFNEESDDETDDGTADLVRMRDQARSDKDWARAQELGQQLENRGWTVDDTPSGTQVHR